MPEVNDSPISREGNATATGSGQVGMNTTGRREDGVKFTAARNLSIILCMAICIGVLLYEMTYTIPTAMQARACNDFVRTHPDILESWWNAYGQPIENSTIAGMTVPQEWGTAGRAETP